MPVAVSTTDALKSVGSRRLARSTCGRTAASEPKSRVMSRPYVSSQSSPVYPRPENAPNSEESTSVPRTSLAAAAPKKSLISAISLLRSMNVPGLFGSSIVVGPLTFPPM